MTSAMLLQFPDESTRDSAVCLVRYSATWMGPNTYRSMSHGAAIAELQQDGRIDVYTWEEARDYLASLPWDSPVALEFGAAARKAWPAKS